MSEKYVKLNLELENYEDVKDDILLSFPWNQVNVQLNVIVSVCGKFDESEKSFIVSNDFGLLIVNPDFLISSTKISQSLFCQRKAVLSNKFQLNAAANLQMVVGVLVHELFQKALSSILINGTKPNVVNMCDEVLKSRDLAFTCYENLLSIDMVKKPLMDFAQKIKEFLAYNIKNPLQENQKMNPNGPSLKIDKIHDIEENVWSPYLGLKGKVDVTVHLHGRARKQLAPFELKTGKASMEHRAQIILYVAMMKQMNCDVNSGLLYYLQENVLSEIEAKHNEVRDLILSRNELVHFLDNCELEPISSECQPSQRHDIIKLPEPLTRMSTCEKCEYKLICAMYQCNSENNEKSYPIQNIGETILRHLSKTDLIYFFKWAEILFTEEKSLSEDQTFNELWTQTPWKRFESGKALIELTLQQVVQDIDGNLIHTFLQTTEHSTDHIHFEVGQYVVISTSNRVAISTGIVTSYKKECIEVSLDRDLRVKYFNEKCIVDKWTARNFLNFCYGNIALLMQDTPPSNNLRTIIVNKQPPKFSSLINTVVPTKLSLNEVQQKIVENAVNCKNYMLIKGYAGTGKTETIVAVINELYKQGKSVIITSHTHSAIDNILLRLQNTGLEFLRIGKISRVREEIKEFAEPFVTKDCKSPADFESIYSKYRIVAATCYGVVHPLFSRRMFDICIVDEATQVTQPLILRSLLCAKSFILVGDPYQLPPVVKSNKAKLLGGDESLFCRLDFGNQFNELRIQYRMNTQIGNLANDFAYEKRLFVGEIFNTINCLSELVQFDWESRIFSSKLTDSTLFLDTGYAYDRNIELIYNKSFAEHMAKLSSIGREVTSARKVYVNLLEAVLVLHLILKLLKGRVAVEDIGVIASYRSQVECIKSMVKDRKQLQNLEINTVDQYQGRDKRIIIYSCTKSKRTEQRKGNSTEILDDHRRLTVAITRAREKLIVIGDSSSILENDPFKRLFQCMTNCIIQISDSFYNIEWPQLLRDLPTLGSNI